VVESFASNKAPGRDKVSMVVIKDALSCILPTLTEIVNRSLMSLATDSSCRSVQGYRYGL